MNTFLTHDDFSKMNIEKSKIHLIDLQKSFYNLDELKEDLVIYIIQSNKEIFSNILESYFLISSKFQGVETSIIFIPGESYEIIEYMMGNDLINKFKILSFNIDLFPIDNDLLSLENENCFREIYIDKDLTSISELANAFVKLESCFGKVKHSYIKGDNAKIFEDLVREKEIENGLKTTNEILGMIVLDRSVDFLTPLITNYTYEGLIDDFFGINLSTIKIKESFIKAPSKKRRASKNDANEKLVTYHLNSFMNNFYNQIGCMYYLDAIKYIKKVHNYYSNIAKEDKHGEKNTLEQLEKLASDYNTFMNELKEPLSTNENIIYYIIDSIYYDENYTKYIQNEKSLLTGEKPTDLHLYYEDYISDKRDLHQILKLMVIENLTQGGITNYEEIKRDILNIYGYQNIFLFRDLEHLGWLKGNKGISYSQVLKDLELLRYSNSQKIEDCSYVMNGFCPISLRLIEKAIEGKWTKIQEVIKKIPGEVSFPLNEIEITKPTQEVNTIFLVFVGGITYAEIEGVRYLNKKFKESFDKSTSKNPKRLQLIIVTTGILNSKKLFKNLGKEFKNYYTMKQFHEQATKKK